MDTRTRIVIFLLAVAIPLLGYIVEVLLGKFRLRGYGQIARDVRLLGTAVHGKTDRHGEDVVLRGNVHSWPVSVRFSQSDLEPGLNIKMSVPSSITLYCIPRNQEHEGGRVPLHAADPRFDARFRISTNHPLEASIVFTSNVRLEVEKLCSSTSTLLAMENRTLELSELVLPEDNVYQHVLSQIEGMAKIADATAQMPGAAATKSGSGFARQWNWFRTAYIAFPILLVLSAFVLTRAYKAPNAPSPPPYPAGIARDEAAQVPDIQEWHLAQPVDFEPGAVSWLQQRGSKLRSRIPVSFTNSTTGGVAYILKKNAGTDTRSARLVMFVDGQFRFDSVLPELAVVAPIPLNSIESIPWTGRAPVGQPDSDGILLVRRLDVPETATVLFFSGLRLLSGRPKDYQNLPVR